MSPTSTSAHSDTNSPTSNFNKANAPSLIKHFRDCIKAAPRELYANCILTAGPRGKGALVVIQICYAGPRAEGLPFLQAISSWEGEPCLLNEVQEKAFVWQQDSVAKVLKGGCESPVLFLGTEWG